ncbi:MAG: DUF2752 domain-containing protein, partial [Thermoanaerobaculia bacterium]
DARAWRGEWWLRVGLVALCLGLPVAAALPAPAAPGADGGLTVAGHPLPEVCALKRTTGVPCPGCGLTRAWVSAVHGDFAGSLAHHPLGWLILAYALAQGTRHGAWLALPGRRAVVERLGAPLDRGVIALAALLFVAWIPRLIGVLSTT